MTGEEGEVRVGLFGDFRKSVSVKEASLLSEGRNVSTEGDGQAGEQERKQ